MQDAGGVRSVSVHRAPLGQLFRYQCTRQAVAPNSPQRQTFQRLAKVGSDSDGETDTSEAVKAQNRYGLQDAGDGHAGGVQCRICDREHFAGERRVKRDEVAELTYRYVFVVRQLENADGDLRKGGNSQVGPGNPGWLVTLSTNLHSLGIPSWNSVR